MQSFETTGFSDVDASGKSAELVEYLTFLAERMAEMRRKGLDLLNLQAGAAALDVGCGVGEVCVELARRVGPHGQVAGVDLSEVMIRSARELSTASGQKIDFRVAGAGQLPFPDQSFDVVRRNACSNIWMIRKPRWPRWHGSRAQADKSCWSTPSMDSGAWRWISPATGRSSRRCGAGS